MNQPALMRNSSIDLLRFVGLSLIILAHVNPPYVLFNLRCFDVPMMLFISGLVYSNRKIDAGVAFWGPRIFRLVVPVYIFFTVYFLLTAVLRYVLGIDFGITIKHIVGSFLLTEGIGYVWIIRVFLLISILMPALIAINRTIRNDMVLFLFLVAISLGLTVAIRVKWGMENIFVREYLYYAIGYSIPFVIGLRVMNMGIKTFIRFFMLISAFLGICSMRIFMGGGNLLDINMLKYPPQSYFLFYGLFMSLVCYAVCCRTHISKNIPAICRFIGMNTIWIYLYHIPFVQITGLVSLSWWVRYIVVYVAAVAMCRVQVVLVERYCSSLHREKFFKYLKG